MIQFKEITMGNEDKETEELAKVLDFLDNEGIEYDLEPPEEFDRYETIGDATYLRTKEGAKVLKNGSM